MNYLEKNTILKIDGIEGMNMIEPASVDLIFADLPYGCTNNPYDKIIPFEPMWEAIKRVRKPNAAIVLFGQGKFFIQMAASNIDEFRYDYTWNKVLKSGFLNAAVNPLRQHENLAVFYAQRPTYNPQFQKGKPLHSKGNPKKSTFVNRNYDKFFLTDDSRAGETQKYPTSVLDYPVSDKDIDFYVENLDYDAQIFEVEDFLEFRKVHPSAAIHQTEKPQELCDFIIKTYCNKGDTVLDFCCGSGSIPLSAARNGMYYYGFDIGVNTNPKSKYYNMDWAEITKKRIKEYEESPKQTTFDSVKYESESGEQINFFAA